MICHACEIIPILSLLEVDIFNYGMRAQGFNPKTRGRESGEGIVQWFKILALSHRPLF